MIIISTFVIGDVHGCYTDLKKMLDLIKFSDNDELVMIGDYIDRGSENYEMLKWCENVDDNVLLIRGNHEEEFITNVRILSSISDSHSLLEICTILHNNSKYFDIYGTIRQLIYDYDITLDELIKWANIFDDMPYFFTKKINGKKFIMVHAGYKTGNKNNEDLQNFYLYSREEAYKEGGLSNSVLVAGHTPTIIPGEFVYNDGNVFKYRNEQINCTYYNIDCGCVFRKKESHAKLACIRLDDEKIFYI